MLSADHDRFGRHFRAYSGFAARPIPQPRPSGVLLRELVAGSWTDHLLSTLSTAICDAVASVVGGPVPLHAPEVSGNEWTYVKECLDTEWVSTGGSYVERFEADLILRGRVTAWRRQAERPRSMHV